MHNSSTYKLKDSSTQKLKFLSFILQYYSNFRSVLAKIQVKKQVKSHYFYPFTPCFFSIFKPETCILHHFAFLVWLPARNFSSPLSHFWHQKTNFLTTISPFLAIFLMIIKGFVYTIAVHFYAFHLMFCTILYCVLHHFTLHLAPKRTAFCTKTHCISHQNALHFAAYYSRFSNKHPQK